MRHRGTCKGVAGLLKRWTHQEALTEQRVPGWDRPRLPTANNPDTTERAILDIEYTEENQRQWIDVTVRHPSVGNRSELVAAGKRPGEAARRAEKAKHERYPGHGLVAFAVELSGRLGAEARQWLGHQTQRLPEDQRQYELTRAYKVVSCAVQSQMAL